MIKRTTRLVNSLAWRTQQAVNHFYAHPSIRLFIGLARFNYFVRIRGIRTLEGGQQRINTISHNLEAFKHIGVDFSMPRMRWLINAVAAVETTRFDSKILVIGPRTESDIMMLKGHGFRDIVAIDIITYSPDVILADMHSMPFNDNFFDIVICGWTLSYSNHPQKAVAEMLRVLKNQGIIAFGLEHVRDLAWHVTTKTQSLSSILPHEDIKRINTCNDLIDLLGSYSKHVYFRHDAPLANLPVHEIQSRNGLASSQVMLVAEIVK